MEKFEPREPGLRAVRLAVEPHADFESIVEQLKQILTIPRPSGCAPCLSGLDRLVIDSTIFERVAERTFGV
jgi:hypothetical protein